MVNYNVGSKVNMMQENRKRERSESDNEIIENVAKKLLVDRLVIA